MQIDCALVMGPGVAASPVAQEARLRQFLELSKVYHVLHATGAVDPLVGEGAAA